MRHCLFLKGMLLATLIFVADNLSKFYILHMFDATPPPIEITSFFNLVLVWNRGISFGILNAYDMRILLILFTFGIVCALLVWMWRSRERWTILPAGAIVGGAFGNIVDRLRFGAVADFLDFHLMGYHWPAFNVADSAIVIGVGFLAWASLRRHPAELP